MGQYITNALTWNQMSRFVQLFDEKIGAKIEIKYNIPSRYSAICDHLFPTEIDSCKAFEIHAIGYGELYHMNYPLIIDTFKLKRILR